MGRKIFVTPAINEESRTCECGHPMKSRKFAHYTPDGTRYHYGQCRKHDCDCQKFREREES